MYALYIKGGTHACLQYIRGGGVGGWEVCLHVQYYDTLTMRAMRILYIHV